LTFFKSNSYLCSKHIQNGRSRNGRSSKRQKHKIAEAQNGRSTKLQKHKTAEGKKQQKHKTAEDRKQQNHKTAEDTNGRSSKWQMLYKYLYISIRQ
jgi:hypothetical protein